MYTAQFTFLTENPLPDEVGLKIDKAAGFENGCLFELIIDCSEDFSGRFYDGLDRMNIGYFFVQKDKILFLQEPVDSKQIETEKYILSHGAIVCQDAELKDNLSEDDQGFHEYIAINGNKREYHSYNTQVETGFYQDFVWEKGKGLVEYRSGFGAQKDEIYLQLITINEDNSATDDFK